jgi:nicotinamide riboside kinase
MSSTKIINLFGGAGAGKSTTSALLFAEMKIRGLHVELVREYVKLWAWGGRKVRPEDQIYLLGKQSAYESMLYGKVDYIVTDSPVFLAGAYSEWYSGAHKGAYVTAAADAFIALTQQAGHEYINFYLERGDKPYDPRGRWGDKKEALEFDDYLERKLRLHNHPYTTVSGGIRGNVTSILTHLGVY